MSEQQQQTTAPTPIAPALTESEWRISLADPRLARDVGSALACFGIFDGNAAPALAALANAALPDNDPRKITRAMVERMRRGAAALLNAARDGTEWDEADALERDAGTLAALLPPESA